MAGVFHLRPEHEAIPPTLDLERLSIDEVRIAGWYGQESLASLDGKLQGRAIFRAVVGEERAYTLGPTDLARWLRCRYTADGF
jgi:hypothetical protein